VHGFLFFLFLPFGFPPWELARVWVQ
jgi:hypothetical protein